MPRRSVVDAARTRAAIVQRAAAVASLDGLDGITLGRLAEDLGMSKAGVIGHFGTKEALQLEAIEAARERFVRAVWDPVKGREPGLDRLLALLDGWISDLTSTPLPGGCFWAATVPEFDSHPGPVRDAIASIQGEWDALLRGEVKAAVAAGELDAGTDVAQVVFELRAVGLGLNQQLLLHDDEAAERRARRAVRRILGRPELPIPRRRRG